MKDHAADILAIIRNLDIDNVVLVGLSMVAQLIAGLGNLGGLRGLILISLAPLTPLCLPEDMREQQIHANDDETSAEFVARNVLTAAPHSDSVMVSLVSDMLRGNQDARAAWPSYGMAEDISAAASAIACPVLVVAIANDKVEPLERVQK
ncbi:unnamed protein product [Clonostachys rosea f. rosea IK726]|uniref:Uncharacterized protein n=1 Tax=Clonostachys rosea f. rosea IK726 TaxID=1349383 RepID=A0ACA9UIC5_BIOOC|nr:unnamed protein product [Clonostachys rosea f. rosea IK726]